MQYDDLISRLLSLPRYRKDLSVASTFARRLSHPEKAFPTVHIGGSNGKGSVSGKIAKACSLAGLKTGLFTSPHLFCFEERIKIDDQMIPKEKMAAGLLKLFLIAEEEGFIPTLFEIVTFLAFDYFREEKVEIAIIEVGMGGRLDATNLISPLVSIITSISREHVQYLGETLDEIAAEKAGILKPNTPAVIGPKAHFDPIIKKAKELGCPLHEVSGAYSFYDYENQAIAGVALSILSKKIALSKKNIKEGLQFRPSCRFEIRGGMIFDVAHNPDGFMRLQQALKTHYPDEQFRFVIGMSPTKEIEPSFRAIVANASAFHLVQSQDGLTVPTHQLEPHVKKLEIPYFLEKTIGEAIRNAKAASTPNERIVVCGSFYIMLESYHC